MGMLQYFCVSQHYAENKVEVSVNHLGEQSAG